MGKILKADYKGELKLGDILIPCAVLEDGTRVLNEANIIKNFGSTGGKNYKLRKKNNQDNEIGPIPLFVASKALEPFIDSTFDDMDLIPIEYSTDGENTLKGYNATILPKVCEIWLKAREHKTLQSSQLPKAMKAEILMRSLAKVGITALVDEATGYQYDREKEELQKILGFYIAEEKRKWEKTFPDELYRQFFRLNNWDYTVNGIKNRPGVIGTWTNTYIYDQLPTGVREKLKEKVSKSQSGNDTERMHSYLTEDGLEHLTNQIRDTIPLMRIADNFEEFKYLFQKSLDRQKGQYELPFETDSKGHIIEEKEIDTLSRHNKNLKKALEYNPNKDKIKSEQGKLF
ncbi:MAG: P63C domain-containing protein [Campylobacterota bacterium]